ncbi:hypothetical protein M758_4G071600 [Ceratodon purpureus]|uniref:Uncharacterized protein n=1 Tax=Ceratodon purpureus TaxID=3225 RepID=A0A8T0I6I5_CERPU|nr:hypothetical protein KC19_4G070700 [Ceratodon purpureus]KAG0579073.1 hypothetical protein KC19_4G070700 [Ceratodon purpureus]KAG0618532.1 hypothetical protein M758_4G071600 [Ceratodon purpureus]KAG0618533.1 hypothetical protein M758_4G071600 [Ceratodon purpureus]
MAVCWSFGLVLLLTLAVLVAPSQPLFQPPAAGTHHLHARENSKAVIETQNSLATSMRSDAKQSWNALVGRHGRFRRLFQRGNDFVCDEQLNCKRRKFTPTTPVLDPERAQTREILANYRLPQKHSTRFQSERMVPTGPNPLHNSNRSQVIFP